MDVHSDNLSEIMNFRLSFGLPAEGWKCLELPYVLIFPAFISSWKERKGTQGHTHTQKVCPLVRKSIAEEREGKVAKRSSRFGNHLPRKLHFLTYTSCPREGRAISLPVMLVKVS